MKIELGSATLIKRYKRFLADVILTKSSNAPLKKNEVTTIHVANTGAMTGCAESGNTVFYSTSNNPKRKYSFSWEVSQNKSNHFICVNTLRANQLVEEALNNDVIKELSGFSSLTREVKYGSENSRIDFLLEFPSSSHRTTSQNNARSTYVEVKSVTLLDDELVDATNDTPNNKGQGFFPDTVSIRGQKHLRELIEMVQQGHRAVLLFAVLHSGINQVSAAKHIDEKYAELLKQAQKAGVEILVYKARFDFNDLLLNVQLSESIAFN